MSATADRDAAVAVPDLGDPRAFADDAETPFTIGFEIRGVKKFFFNAGNVDEYEKREAASKKKIRLPDNPEAKVWRDGDGNLCVPGNEVIKAMGTAARGRKDPTNSGHRSMRPVVPLAMQVHEEMCPFIDGKGKPVRKWDDTDARLVRYNNKSMAPTRRPTLDAGWRLGFSIDVTWPEIFAPADVATLVARAGMIGIGDATTIGYGKFIVVRVEEPTEIRWT